ncbi:MAG: flagellin FliC [Bdellovibrionales bacterium]|nr:flagellin FliC [Bdellovibrionales bacterium]
MGFRISSNIGALSAARYLSKAQRQTEESLRSIASGSRVDNPANDAAGFAISEQLKSQTAGLKQAKFNGEAAISFIQTAEGTLNEQNNILIRLRELGVIAASDTVGDLERDYLNNEFQQLVSEFDRIAKTARFGGKQLLTGDGTEFEFHVGENNGPENVIKFKLDANTQADQVGIQDLSVGDQDAAGESLENIDEAINKVVGTRASFGAAQSRFQYAIDNLSSQVQNIEAARSTIADVDLAEEVSNLTRSQIMTDIATSVLAQANASNSRVLKLIG